MRKKDIAGYALMGFILLLAAGTVANYIYHRTYTRDSYDVAECSKKYRFVEVTFPRLMRLYSTAATNPKNFAYITVFPTFTARQLNEAGLLKTVLFRATSDPEEFLWQGSRRDASKTVVFREIPSPIAGEESVYCVVDAASLPHDAHSLERMGILFGIYLKSGPAPHDDFYTRVVSWGPPWFN